MEHDLLYVSVGITLCFAFVNGFHDGGNVIATIVGSRAMHPYRALLLATAAEFIGPLVIGTSVAGSIFGIFKPAEMSKVSAGVISLMVISASLGAILWKLPSWFLGLPSSSSHAILSGLAGAALVAMGREGIDLDKMLKGVALPLVLSPIVGVVLGYLCFGIVRSMAAHADRSIGHFFVAVQKPLMAVLAASQGSNDAQKSMGLIALVLLAHGGSGQTPEHLPFGVMAACAAALAAGVAAGGLRIVKAVGYDLYRMQPVHSFVSLLTSTSVVAGASFLGGPVSTTQVVGASVVGVGASRRLSGVRWASARNIGYAWFVTVPVCAALSAALFLVLKRCFVPG